jgi:hypothetical protein
MSRAGTDPAVHDLCVRIAWASLRAIKGCLMEHECHAALEALYEAAREEIEKKPTSIEEV